MAGSRGRGRKKKSSKKKPTPTRKNSSLKKANRKSSRNKMARNKEKYKKSKQNLQQKKEEHAKTMKSEKKRFESDKQKIQNDPNLTPVQKRDKLTTAQYQRRLREKAATEHLHAHEQAHAAHRAEHRAVQQRQEDKYRRRKRAVDFSDRMRVTQQSTTVVAPQQRPYAAAQSGYGQPMYGVASGGYGGQPMGYGQPAYGVAPGGYGQPMYGVAPGGYGQPAYGDVPEQVPYGVAPEGPPPYEAGPSEVPPPQEETREEVPTRGVLTGKDEVEMPVEMRDIVALRDLDPRALQAFLRARDNFDQATTQEDKIRYSIEFFEVASKLDTMFHLHTDVWHRAKKYRPLGRTVEDVNAFTDALSKEEVAELSKMSNDDLHNYLVTAM